MKVETNIPKFDNVRNKVWVDIHKNFPHTVEIDMTPESYQHARQWLKERNIRFLYYTGSGHIRTLSKGNDVVSWRFKTADDAMLFRLMV